MGSRNFICLALACGIFLLLVLNHHSSHSSAPHWHSEDNILDLSPGGHGHDAPDPASQEVSPDALPIPAEKEHTPLTGTTPALTMIVLWSPHKRNEDYLPSFFATVGANPSIDLLLIKFDKYGYENGECERAQAAGVPNVREVCLSMEEYYALHVE